MHKIVPHNRLTFGDAECDAVLRVVRSGQWAQGPRVEELENTLAQMAGVKHAVCVASGLAALRLSLGALKVRAGDSVLVPAYSCVALANSAMACGAAPVPVDIEGAFWTLDPKSCVQLASASTRAAIAVNTFGAPADVVKGALLSSGMYDLKPVRLSKRSKYVKFTDEMEEALSAQRHIDKLYTPLILAHGTYETPEFQRQTREFAAALKAAGKQVTLLVGEGYNHFEIPETMANPYGLLGRAVLAQMRLTAAA